MKPPLYHYRVVIAYKGSNYFGWQDLGDDGKKQTIQFCLTEVLRNICNFEECRVSGASRTDAGVHAMGQVAKLTLVKEIVADKLLLGMNSLLPNDIRVMSCMPCPAEFNAGRDSVSKTYRYYFSLDAVSSPLINDTVAHINLINNERTSSQQDETMWMETMRRGCEQFIGEYDFYSFAMNNKQIKSTVRRILRFELHPTSFLDTGSNIYYFEIEGSGFLRLMIRYIVGALFELARGNISSAQIDAALHQHNDNKLSAKAKARGLHLMRINY